MKANPMFLAIVIAIPAGCVAQTGDGPVDKSGEAITSGDTYNFGTLANPGACMDALGSGTADGTQIQEYWCNGSGAQSFSVKDAGNGAYYIVNTNANKCIDVQARGTANGTKIQLYDCNQTPAQTFWIEPQANGFVTLVNTNANKCLDVQGDNPANGTVVQLYDCNGTNAQLWNPAVIGSGGGGSSSSGGGSSSSGGVGGGSGGGNGSTLLVVVKNNCPVDLWINAVNNPAPPAAAVTLSPNNAHLSPGASQQYQAPNDWSAARVNAFFEAPDANGNPQGQSDKVEMNFSSTNGVETTNTDITYVDWVALPSQIQVFGSGNDCTTVGCDVPFSQILDGCPASLVSGRECVSAGGYCLNPSNDGDPYCHALDGQVAACASEYGDCAGAAGGTTAQAYSCSGFFGGSPEYCAALNRGVLNNPSGAAASSYYTSPPFNTYSQWVHQHCPGIYAFPYDDYGPSNQSSDHTCSGATEVAITFCPAG
jgi:hypothetical protein